MNNPNPFVPKGSLLEQQSQRRSRLKLAVFCVLAVSVTGLVAMLIQGCKREAPETPPADTSNPPALEASNNIATPPDLSSNLASPSTSNTVAMPPTPPLPPTPLPPTPPVEPAATAGSDYVIVAGDTLGKIAKAHGVSLKALEAANPGVDSKKLKIKQHLVIPAATPAAAATDAAAPSGSAAAGGETYLVKSGDNLSKIAKRHGVTLKALKAANNLTTDHIKVNDKLIIPAKTEAAPAPATETTAAPMTPPVSAPAPAPAPFTPAPAPAPGH
jgi:LysM repeat protein